MTAVPFVPQRRFGILTAILIFLCCMAFPARAAAPDVVPGPDVVSGPDAVSGLDDLREKAASMVSVTSDFTQETTIPMFAQPMRSHGRFAFKRPRALRWEFTSPMREGFVLNGDNGFRWEGADGARVPFTPGSDPAAAIIARQLMAWITFDMAAIGKEYRIETIGQSPFKLRMTPLREDVRGVIESIAVTFTPQGPASLVELRETQGGGTVITFHNTVVNGPLDKGEFERP